jgi:hypothetical protein
VHPRKSYPQRGYLVIEGFVDWVIEVGDLVIWRLNWGDLAIDGD